MRKLYTRVGPDRYYRVNRCVKGSDEMFFRNAGGFNQ